ncbi:unnamed protein product [Gordionus sp. m RMFG-2023]
MAEIQNLQKNNSIWKSIAAENSIETVEIAKSTDSFLREHKKLKCLKNEWKFPYKDAVEIECVETSQSQSTDVRNDASPSTSESYVPGKKLIKKRDIDQDLFVQL